MHIFRVSDADNSVEIFLDYALAGDKKMTTVFLKAFGLVLTIWIFW